MLTGQALPRMESKGLQNHPFKEGLADRSRRVGGVAVFTDNHSGQWHGGAIISGLNVLSGDWLADATMAANRAFAQLAAIVLNLVFLVKALVRRAGCWQPACPWDRS